MKCSISGSIKNLASLRSLRISGSTRGMLPLPFAYRSSPKTPATFSPKLRAITRAFRSSNNNTSARTEIANRIADASPGSSGKSLCSMLRRSTTSQPAARRITYCEHAPRLLALQPNRTGVGWIARLIAHQTRIGRDSRAAQLGQRRANQPHSSGRLTRFAYAAHALQGQAANLPALLRRNPGRCSHLEDRANPRPCQDRMQQSA